MPDEFKGKKLIEGTTSTEFTFDATGNEDLEYLIGFGPLGQLAEGTYCYVWMIYGYKGKELKNKLYQSCDIKTNIQETFEYTFKETGYYWVQANLIFEIDGKSVGVEDKRRYFVIK